MVAILDCEFHSQAGPTMPGPIGGGSLSSWKEPEVKKKEEPGDLSSAEKVPSKLKLRGPEDNKNKNLSSADDQGN